MSARTSGTASDPDRLPSLARASGCRLRSAQAVAMTCAASDGMTPTSPWATASARSKSSIPRTNASGDRAWVNASRAKLWPTRLTGALAR